MPGTACTLSPLPTRCAAQCARSLEGRRKPFTQKGCQGTPSSGRSVWTSGLSLPKEDQRARHAGLEARHSLELGLPPWAGAGDSTVAQYGGGWAWGEGEICQLWEVQLPPLRPGEEQGRDPGGGSGWHKQHREGPGHKQCGVPPRDSTGQQGGVRQAGGRPEQHRRRGSPEAFWGHSWS